MKLTNTYPIKVKNSENKHKTLKVLEKTLNTTLNYNKDSKIWQANTQKINYNKNTLIIDGDFDLYRRYRITKELKNQGIATTLAYHNQFEDEKYYYNQYQADRAVTFIQCLRFTKGEWNKKPFRLLYWQEKIIRDIFGTLNRKTDDRRFNHAYIEIPKKNGKSELAAAVALYLFFIDAKDNGEIYTAAADRAQASIVFENAQRMIETNNSLRNRCKILPSTKTIRHTNGNRFQVLSSEAGTKHGLSISGLVFDELHAQKTRALYDSLTKGTGDARRSPLFFYITTAGSDRNSICYELHEKAQSIEKGTIKDEHFYSVIYSYDPKSMDWQNPRTWFNCNPSIGETITLEKVENLYTEATTSRFDELIFRQNRLNEWTSIKSKWINVRDFRNNHRPLGFDLEGYTCFGGLDLSTTTDLTAFVLTFPPQNELNTYYVLPFFFYPEENIRHRVKTDHVPFDRWAHEGHIITTPGNVVDYNIIHEKIKEIAKTYELDQIAFDRWQAIQISQTLDEEGFTMIPFGQGYKSMSPPTKELAKLVLEQQINHNQNPVLNWNIDNLIVQTDPAGNVKPDKAKSTDRIDGAVAMIMSLDRAIRAHNLEKEASISFI